MVITRRKCGNTQAREVAAKNGAEFLKRSRWTYGKGSSCANLLRKGKMGSDINDMNHNVVQRVFSELTSTAHEA